MFGSVTKWYNIHIVTAFSALHYVTDMQSSTANAVFITITISRSFGRYRDFIKHIWPSVPLAANPNSSRDRAW